MSIIAIIDSAESSSLAFVPSLMPDGLSRKSHPRRIGHRPILSGMRRVPASVEASPSNPA